MLLDTFLVHNLHPTFILIFEEQDQRSKASPSFRGTKNVHVGGVGGGQMALD